MASELPLQCLPDVGDALTYWSSSELAADQANMFFDLNSLRISVRSDT